jgi:pyruvate/2-oxoacid:ferredoxin oxidoreductase alpha subunit
MVLMSYKIAEDRSIMLPAMVILDGFILTHTTDSVEVPDQAQVDAFLPPFDPEIVVNVDHPRRYGGLVMPDWWTEYRYRIALDMERAKAKLAEVDNQFQKHFGRSYGGLVEFYRCEDADAALVVAGSAAGTAKDVADRLREKGNKVGVVKVRSLRPFPAEEIRKLGGMVTALAIFDRSFTFGDGGAFFNEVRSALYSTTDMPLKNYVGGLGGRDVTPKNMEWIFEDILRIEKEGKVDRMVEWVGLKDGTGRW